MAVSRTLVASKCWQQLNGILCLFKPTDMSLGRLMMNLKLIIAADLGKMIHRQPRKIVKYDATLGLPVEALEVDYSDHPLVIGPRYDKSDVRYHSESALSFHASGVCLVGLNRGRHLIKDLEASKPIRVYHLVGEFGVATDNLFKTGKVVERASYGKVFRPNIDRVAALFQANHQRLMYQNVGAPLHTQSAYELALKGLVRPADDNVPIIYGIKCIHFEKPYFTIEVTCVNETEGDLLSLILAFGIKLNTVARCNNLKCIRYGPFTLDHTLLRHSWRVQNFVSNIEMCNAINEADIMSGRREKDGMTSLEYIEHRSQSTGDKMERVKPSPSSITTQTDRQEECGLKDKTSVEPWEDLTPSR